MARSVVALVVAPVHHQKGDLYRCPSWDGTSADLLIRPKVLVRLLQKRVATFGGDKVVEDRGRDDRQTALVQRRADAIEVERNVTVRTGLEARVTRGGDRVEHALPGRKVGMRMSSTPQQQGAVVMETPKVWFPRIRRFRRRFLASESMRSQRGSTASL